MAETEAKEVMDLPKGYTPLSDILEEKALPRGLVDVIGLVKGFRAPMTTQKTDYKCQLTLIDLSLSNDSQDVEMAIFRPQKDMPNVSVGDVVVVHRAKTNRWQSNALSLLSNFETTLHIYPAKKIPSPPQQTPPPQTPSAKDKGRKPDDLEGKYVSWLYHNIDKSSLPDPDVFQIQVQQSLNIKKKLCELKEVRDRKFQDLIVQVVQAPYDFSDKVRLYVSDYTENSAFFNYVNKSQDNYGGRDGDPYGYTSGKLRKSDSSLQWQGPFGKRAMQITCWEPHATVIRERVKQNDWVHLLNVQIKYGSDGYHLEGYVREARNAFGNGICVDKLDLSEDPEDLHPSVKNALRRKRDYEKQLKIQSKGVESSQGAGKKRPLADQAEEKPRNSKQRRARKRNQAVDKEKGEDEKIEASPDLNKQVVCENHEHPAVDVAAILEPATQEFTFQNVPLVVKLPFHDAKYRTNVRVVDFHPPRIQDFACARKQNEYDALSDFSGTDSEDEDDEKEHGTLDNFVNASELIWEWRFTLCLQDAVTTNDPKTQKKNQFWVVVDNMDAQLLTGLDACDFRVKPEVLAQLREKMFILWGDLEEKKAKKLAEHGSKQIANVGKKKTTDRPPDSDEEGAAGPFKTEKEAISNRPFTCCVRQFGIQVKEPNPEKADAGHGKRWERMYGLFGTKILGV
ncbi:telomere-binding alpha subunit central domain-containing protein [Colletotrichum orchidophilum]|uniref:Protection of telomeres protein 1 n=1 Tax=Colletotrichum orchidophilum TaxID=1209926 RepID=A0A1G4ARU9_9PEZI|nr:telomere-binding alpha subunit central domain-containing protein [Colletotrichum orchidophilum]OHE91888.1 telomere-binding alpha subunit central domain-containing protein [Colletotrichum orchidophilum]